MNRPDTRCLQTGVLRGISQEDGTLLYLVEKTQKRVLQEDRDLQHPASREEEGSCLAALVSLSALGLKNFGVRGYYF